MEPTLMIGLAIAAIRGGMETYAWAQERGYFGGASQWAAPAAEAAKEFAGFLGRAHGLVTAITTPGAEHDTIAKLPQAELEAEIRRRLYPTPLSEKLNTWRKARGLAQIPEEGTQGA